MKRWKIRLPVLQSKFYFIHESVPHTKNLNFQKIYIFAQGKMEQKADSDATGDGNSAKIPIPALLDADSLSDQSSEEKCTAIIIPSVAASWKYATREL